jgi:hypothetical protein
MKKTIEITVPTSWSAVPYKKYRELQKDIEDYKDEPLAIEHFIFFHLTGMTPDILSGLDTETYENMRNDLYSFMKQEEFPLQRIIEVDGVKYGFEPNLSKLAYGAYLDITSYKNIELNDDWNDIMTILYRPVISKRGELYEIEKYSGFKAWDTEKWDKVGMDIHFGCFFLFKNLLRDLRTATLNSMKKEARKHPNIESILARNGEVINLLHSYRETPFSILVK